MEITGNTFTLRRDDMRDQDKKAGHQAMFLHDNINAFRSIMGFSSDFMTRELTIRSGQKLALLYIDGMIDKKTLQESVIHALLERPSDAVVGLEELKESVLRCGEAEFAPSREAAINRMFSGSALLLLENSPEMMTIAMPGWEDRSITESKAQTVVRGPQDSFTETLRTNTTLVRRRIKDTNLRIENVTVGERTKTDIAILYLDGTANEKIVRKLKDQLESAKMDRVLEGQYLEELLLKNQQKSLFPTIYNSDRPDTISAGILEGRVGLIVDGTPFALLVPSLFVDFIQSSEDYSQAFIYSNIIRLLRYLALLVCLLAPSVYIALTTFHQDMLPTQLLLSLMAQREGVPFPAFIEALLMEGTFEILREAGVRMPRNIGQAVSIVGTIVIGQAAVEASIVSAAMVIVVAITAISSFVIPAYAMSIPLRIIRFGFMALAASFGAFGLTLGIIVLVVHLCSLQSFGVPYMSPVAPFDKEENHDGIFRFPFRNRNQRYQ